MGTGTSTSLLLTDFQDLPITAQERLRYEYDICRSDGMEEEEVFYSLERSLIDEIQKRLQVLRVHSQQSSNPEEEGGSVGSHDSNGVGSMSSLGQQSTTTNIPKHQHKPPAKSSKIPGRTHLSKSPSSLETSQGLFPPLPASPQSQPRSITNKPTNTTGPPRYWEGEYLNEIEEDASYLEDTINRRVHIIRSKNERLLQKKNVMLTSHSMGDKKHSLTSGDVQSLASNGSSTHYASSVNYSISPLKPHLHPYAQVVEVGWKHVAEGLRRRVAEMNSKHDETTGNLHRVEDLTKRNELLQQQMKQMEEEKLAMIAQWEGFEQQRVALIVSHREEVDMWKAEVASLQGMLENPEEGKKMLQEAMTSKEKDRVEMTRTLESLHIQLASMQEQIGLSKTEHERVVHALMAQHADQNQQQHHQHQQLVQQLHQQVSTLEASLTAATAAAQEKDVRLGALRAYKIQAKADLARLAGLVEQNANQLVFEKEGRERGALRLASQETEIQRLTEENSQLSEVNRQLTEENETSQTRIATLMDVREVVTAKDTSRSTVIADLQDALHDSKDLQDRLTVAETTVQRLTEQNRQLTEECETAQLRIATLMEVRAVASAKDTRRTSVIADLQETLVIQQQELEQLRQSQKQQPLTENDDDDEEGDEGEEDEKQGQKVGEMKTEKNSEELQQRVRGLEAQLVKVSEWLSSLSTEGSHDLTAQMAQVDQFITELSTQNDEMMDRLYVLENVVPTTAESSSSDLGADFSTTSDNDVFPRNGSVSVDVGSTRGIRVDSVTGASPSFRAWRKESVYGQNVVTLTRVNEELTVHAAKLSERLAQGEQKVQKTVEKISAMQSKLLGENQGLKNEIKRLTTILETTEPSASSTSPAVVPEGGGGVRGGGKGESTDGIWQQRYDALVLEKNQLQTRYDEMLVAHEALLDASVTMMAQEQGLATASGPGLVTTSQASFSSEEKNKFEKELKTTKMEIRALTEDNDRLRGQIATLQTENTSIKGSLTDQANTIKLAKVEMAMVKRDNEKLQTRLNDVTEKEEHSVADLMHSVLENQLMHAQISALQEEIREKDGQMVSLQGMLATFSSPPGSATLVGGSTNSTVNSTTMTVSDNVTTSTSSQHVENDGKKWERAVRVLQAQLSQMQATYYRQIADQPVNNPLVSTLSEGRYGDGERVTTAGSQVSLHASMKSEIESLLNGELLGHMEALTVQNHGLTNELKEARRQVATMAEKIASLRLSLDKYQSEGE